MIKLLGLFPKPIQRSSPLFKLQFNPKKIRDASFNFTKNGTHNRLFRPIPMRNHSIKGKMEKNEEKLSTKLEDFALESKISIENEENRPFSIIECVETINLLTSNGIHSLDEIDRKILRDCCEEAAKRGHSPSQLLCGIMCSQGVGGEIDHRSAIYWFLQASDGSTPLVPSIPTISPSHSLKKDENSNSKRKEEIVVEDVKNFKEAQSKAQYAAAFTFLTGNSLRAFSSLVPKKQLSIFFDPESKEFVLGDGTISAQELGANPNFDFKKWYKSERKKNVMKKKRRMEGKEEPSANIERDPERGMKLLTIYCNGLPGVQKVDVKEGIRWLKVASDSFNHSEACRQLAVLYFSGEGNVVKDPIQESLKYFQRASDLGNLEASFWLGHANHRGIEGVFPQNVERAIEILRANGEKGYSGSLYYLSSMFRNGDQVPKNRRKFHEYLEKALDKNDADALYCYGDMYYNGEKELEESLGINSIRDQDLNLDEIPWIKVDHSKALEFFSKAARTENSGANLGAKLGFIGEHSNATTRASAFVNEGSMYFNGLGTKIDMEKAFNAYQNAILLDSNHVAALYNLANMYHHGLGVGKNELMADNFLKRAEKMENDLEL